MSEYDYTRSPFNCFTLVTPDAVFKGLKSVSNFSEFSKTVEKSEDLVRYSFVIAGEMTKSGLKMNQLRKFYNYVKKMQYEVEDEAENNLDKVKARFKFLLPKLAGASSKEAEVKPLYDIVAACNEKSNIQTKYDVLWFIEFFEAILNYFEVLSQEKSEQLEKAKETLNKNER